MARRPPASVPTSPAVAGFFGTDAVAEAMAVYERRSRVAAPLTTVWRFHVRAEALSAVTPSWMRLRVESARGPDGEPDPDVLEAGTEVSVSVRPFGVGPRRGWTSRIVEFERHDDAAWFRDEMIDGPFPRWVHAHRFHAAGEHTVLTDRVEYRLPVLPGPLSALGWPGFEAMFAYRHYRTRRLLAGNGAEG